MLMKYSESKVIALEQYMSDLPNTLGVKYASVVEAIDPEFVYSVVRGIEGDVFNENYDYWPWDAELLTKKAHGPHKGMFTWETWRGKPNCYGHVNRGPQDHFGKVADCWPENGMRAVDMVLATSRIKNAKLASDVESGRISTVSMGCAVGFSSCSACGKPAYTVNDYCPCVKYEKGKMIPYREAVKRAMANDTTPYIGAVDGDMLKIGEICYDSNGVEMSWVMNPAFISCTSKGLLTPVTKVSQYNMLAGALQHSRNPLHRKAAGVIQKVASKTVVTPAEEAELTKLIDAMGLK